MAVPLLPNQLAGVELAVEVAWGADPNLVDVATWSWSDITEDVRFSGGPIGITTGRGDEASQSQPGKCTLTLDNTGGAYSLGGQSPNWPYVRRNTPVRVRVLGLLRGLFLDGQNGSHAWTPDTAALDITGDIDVRVDVDPLTWRPPSYEILASRYRYPDDVSWTLFLLGNGALELGWASDGINRVVYESTEPVPADSGRLAVRATLDVDNGGGLHTVRFYTASSVDGPWTQLGLAVSGVGATSIHAGSADIVVGHLDTGASTDRHAIGGTVHRFQLRDGIDGTVVADADFDTATAGASSFTDDAGLLWTIAGNAALSAVPLFVGYATSWTPSWDITGRVPTVRLTAAGALRRLKQRVKPVQSTMFRQLSTQPEVVAYWPMEEGTNASRFTSGLTNDATVLTPSGEVAFADSTDYVGSDAIPTVKTGNIRGDAPVFAGAADQRFLVLAAVPEGGVSGTRLLFRVWTSSGSVRRWDVNIDSSGNLQLAGYDAESVNQFTSGVFGFGMNGRRTIVSLWLSQVGADTEWQISTSNADDTSIIFGDGSYTTTYGRIVAVHLGDATGSLNGTAVGHAAILNDNVHAIWDVMRQGMLAWTGEASTDRLARVAGENAVPLSVRGGSDLTMGPQGLDTVLELLREAETTDQGILYDGVSPGLRYVARELRENTDPTLVIDANAYELSPGFAPTDDDQRTVNSVTVKQKDGSQVTASDEASIAAIGLYDASETINTDDAAMLDHYASWLLHLGSLDGYRYPQVTVDVRATPALAAQALALQPSSRIDVTSLGDVLLGHPADTVSLLVEGLSHSISPLEWTVTAQSSPYEPWRIIRLAADTGDTSEYVAHLDTDDSRLSTTSAQDATALNVVTLSGPAWTTDADDMPIDVDVHGWTVTVTDIGAAVVDSYSRSVTDGWGSPDTGPASWDTSITGVAADYAVNGSAGTMTLSATQQVYWAVQPLNAYHFDTTMTATVDQAITGAAAATILAARWSDVDNFYFAWLLYDTSGTITTAIGMHDDAPGVILASSSKTVSNTGLPAVKLRFAGEGSLLRAKMWLATDPEPAVWDVEVTDSTHISGFFAVGAERDFGNTNTDLVCSFDDFTVDSPQRFTVDPLPAELPAGSSVTVSNPPVLGL